METYGQARARLAKLRDDGAGDEAIAAAFGTRPQHVNALLAKYHVSRLWTPANDDRIRDGAKAGKSAARLAVEMKLTRNQVMGRAARIGVHFHAGNRSNGGKLSGGSIARLSEIARGNVVSLPCKPIRERHPKTEPEPIGLVGEISAQGTCKWIHGDPMKPGWRCCGHKALPEQPWCGHHAHRVRNHQATAKSDQLAKEREAQSGTFGRIFG